MTQAYKEAFCEVNEILKYLSKEIREKIPREFIENIQNNMANSYSVEYDKTKGINEQNLKQETRAILSVIYRDYICSEDKRNEIVQEDRKKYLALEENKKLNYIDKEIFKKNSKLEKTEEKSIVVIKKQSIIQKIIEKIRSFWRKQRGQKY